MSAIIIYASRHHQNTKKLLEGINKELDISLVDSDEVENIDISSYKYVGFASGIAFSKPYPSIIRNLNLIQKDHKVFSIITAGSPRENFAIEMINETENKGATYLGTFLCKGFDTFGPFKLIGGINKAHPNEKDEASLNEFLAKILG